MPIEKKPEQVILSGEEAKQAIADGVQRKLGRRIDEKTMKVWLDGGEACVTVDVVGSLKGPKPGTKRKPRAKPSSAA